MKLSKYSSKFINSGTLPGTFMVSGFLVVLTDTLIPVGVFKTGDIFSFDLLVSFCGVAYYYLVSLEDTVLSCTSVLSNAMLNVHIRYFSMISTMCSLLSLYGYGRMLTYIFHEYIKYLSGISMEFNVVLYRYEKLVSPYRDCRRTIHKYLLNLQSEGFLTYNRGSIRVLKDLGDYLF